jgi:hypothetical protein
MPVPSLDDYRAPWETEAGGDAEIDKGKLKKYLHGLLVDKDRLQTTVTEVTTERDTLKTAADEKAREGETELQRLQRENAELKDSQGKAPAESPETLRLRVALEKGLTLTQANRLVGTTQEELAADADAFLAEIGKTPGTEAAARRTPQTVTNGAAQGGDDDDDGDVIDIAKALEQIPRI